MTASPVAPVSGNAISSMGIAAPPPVELTPVPVSQPSPRIYQERVPSSVNTLPEFDSVSARSAPPLPHHVLVQLTVNPVLTPLLHNTSGSGSGFLQNFRLFLFPPFPYLHLSAWLRINHRCLKCQTPSLLLIFMAAHLSAPYLPL